MNEVKPTEGSVLRPFGARKTGMFFIYMYIDR